MLQRLVPQSDEAADAMARLGLDFFDAQGSSSASPRWPANCRRVSAG